MSASIPIPYRRSTLVRLRAPSSARRRLALRNELVAKIEAAWWEVPIGALTHEKKGGS